MPFKIYFLNKKFFFLKVKCSCLFFCCCSYVIILLFLVLTQQASKTLSICVFFIWLGFVENFFVLSLILEYECKCFERSISSELNMTEDLFLLCIKV